MSDFSEPHASGGQESFSAEDYQASRGRPPRAHRFKPGASGNPRGRPKGSKSFGTLMQRELDRTITATVGGRQTKVAKREAIVLRLIDKAMKGDQKAIETVMKYGDVTSAQNTLPPMDTDPGRESEILGEYLRRLDEGSAGHA